MLDRRWRMADGGWQMAARGAGGGNLDAVFVCFREIRGKAVPESCDAPESPPRPKEKLAADYADLRGLGAVVRPVTICDPPTAIRHVASRI